MDFFTNFGRYVPLLIKGTFMTLALWIIAACISLTIGMILGIANCQKLKTYFLSIIITSYVRLAKGVPLYVQLLIAYFVVPELLGINPSAMTVATITAGMCSAGYIAEIIRAGMNGIPKGQWEACAVLGYSTVSALKRIIIPQMIRTSLPALIGEFDQLLKSTALFAAIGVVELTKTAMNIVSRELNPIPVYSLLALIYFGLSLLLNSIGKKIEQGVSYDIR